MTNEKGGAKKDGGKAVKGAERGPKAPSGDSSKIILMGVIVALVISNAVTYTMMKEKMERVERLGAVLAPGTENEPLADYRVVNAHEHLYSRKHLDKYLDAANKTGIARTLFVPSSEYTLYGAGHDQNKGLDKNTQMIMAAAKEFPDKIIPFCGVSLDDPDKLEKIKQYKAAGAVGLKLYSGHGNFHDRPLDVEDMMPVYAWCEENNFPIDWHINLNRYMDEFIRVMEKHPKLTVIVPHFGVTFFQPTREPFKELQRLMDLYPNMYTDTSFGTRQIMVGGLEAVSRYPEIFRAFFEKYQDRILFGSDMVVTGNKEKTPEWVEAVLRGCRDVLEKESYHFFMGALGSAYAVAGAKNTYGAYRGMALDDAILKKVYETNVDRLFPASAAG